MHRMRSLRPFSTCRPAPLARRGAPVAPVRGRTPVAAIILIVLGALFLLGNLGMIPRLGPLIAQWWPLILIAVGVSLLLRR